MMRVDIDFADPLGKADKIRLQLAVATLAKCRRVKFLRGDRAAAVMGEALSERSILAAMIEHGFKPEKVQTSLDPDEDSRADDPVEVATGPERVRAIGR